MTDRKTYFKNYYENNKEKIKQTSKLHYRKNIEVLSKNRKIVNPARMNYNYIVSKGDKTRTFRNCAELSIFFGYCTSYMQMLVQGKNETIILGYKIKKERR